MSSMRSIMEATAPVGTGDQVPVKYDVPEGFDMGVGAVAGLQHKLESHFRSTAKAYNNYNYYKARSDYGHDFTEDLLDSRALLRKERARAIEVMAHLLVLGVEPLPPSPLLDEGVANVLALPLMRPAAEDAAVQPQAALQAQEALQAHGLLSNAATRRMPAVLSPPTARTSAAVRRTFAVVRRTSAAARRGSVAARRMLGLLTGKEGEPYHLGYGLRDATEQQS